MNEDKEYLYDVFLGGSCGATTWRKDFVIPYLKSAGISYFNPQRATWTEDMIKIEERAKNNSRLLLFVVDSSQPSLISLVEIAFLAARNAPLIVVLPTESELAVGPIKECIKSCICHFMACLLVLPLYNRQPKESSEFLPSTSTERCQALTLLLFSLFAQMCFYYASQLIFTDSSVLLHQCIYWCGVEGLLSCAVSTVFECLRSQDSTLDCLQTKLLVRRKPSCRNTFDVYLIGCGTDYNWMRYNVIPQLKFSVVWDKVVPFHEIFLMIFLNLGFAVLLYLIDLLTVLGAVGVCTLLQIGTKMMINPTTYVIKGMHTLDALQFDELKEYMMAEALVLAPLNDYYRRGIMYLKDMAQEFGDLLLVQNLKFAVDQAIFEILNISDDMSDQEA